MVGLNLTFKLHGKVCHRIGSLLPNTVGEPPKFAQIYFHDSGHEVDNRLRHNSHLSRDTLLTLQQCLHQVKPYVQSMKTVIEYTASHPGVRMVLKATARPTEAHVRKHSLPTFSEVAVILSGDQINNLDVVLQTCGGQLQCISKLHWSYDPLHYVILFPYGTNGYKIALPHADERGHVTPVEFYRYRLQVRDINSTFNPLMRSRSYCSSMPVTSSPRLRSKGCAGHAPTRRRFKLMSTNACLMLLVLTMRLMREPR